MLYSEFMYKAKQETIVQADNGLWYLEPDWHMILSTIKLDVEEITDFYVGWLEVESILKLEVEKRNTIDSVKPYVLNWIHDIITASVEPAILKEETDYIKNLTEYLKTKKDAQALKEKEDWDKFKST